MSKKSKIIFPLISLLLVVPVVLVVIFFHGDSIVSAARGTFLGSISSEDAAEIALDYIGHGEVDEVRSITENGVQLYAVDIKDENVDFVIYVHSRTGDVVRMVRTEVGYQGIMTLPEILSPNDLLDLDLD